MLCKFIGEFSRLPRPRSLVHWSVSIHAYLLCLCDRGGANLRSVLRFAALAETPLPLPPLGRLWMRSGPPKKRSGVPPGFGGMDTSLLSRNASRESSLARLTSAWIENPSLSSLLHLRCYFHGQPSWGAFFLRLQFRRVKRTGWLRLPISWLPDPARIPRRPRAPRPPAHARRLRFQHRQSKP